MTNDFAEILDYFKKTAKPDKVVPLINDRKMINALLAWKSVIINYKPLETCEYHDENQRWNWLWDQISFDQDSYQVVSGLKIQEINAYFLRLKGLKLIFPDGTVDNFASSYLNSIIMDALKKK